MEQTTVALPTLWRQAHLFLPARRKSVQERFGEFHAQNPAVFARLAEMALELKRSGKNRYGVTSSPQLKLGASNMEVEG